MNEPVLRTPSGAAPRGHGVRVTLGVAVVAACIPVSVASLARPAERPQTAHVVDVAQTQRDCRGSRRVFHVADGRLTVAAHGASVKALIEAIAQEAGLTLEDHESLNGQITVRFRCLPIADGLARILGDRGYMLLYAVESSPDGGGTTRVPVRLRFFDRPVADEPPAARDAASEEAERAAHFETLESYSDPWDKQDTIDALVETGDPAVARRLGRAALADPDVDVRSAAVDALAILGGPAAVEMLEVALHDREIVIREEAVGALEEIGGEAAVRGLTVALQDADTDLRLLAIDAVGALGGSTAILLLEYAASDPDTSVRDTAEDWLTELRAEPW